MCRAEFTAQGCGYRNCIGYGCTVSAARPVHKCALFRNRCALFRAHVFGSSRLKCWRAKDGRIGVGRPRACREQAIRSRATTTHRGDHNVVGPGQRDRGEGPKEKAGPLRAAQYVRMSTEHQQYSTENQSDAIRLYAERRGIEIVRTYADEGRSGLRLAGREALTRLIADVQSGKADFEAILVYDVSRWGRFQDADESAYYEHICTRARISVH